MVQKAGIYGVAVECAHEGVECSICHGEEDTEVLLLRDGEECEHEITPTIAHPHGVPFHMAFGIV